MKSLKPTQLLALVTAVSLFAITAPFSLAADETAETVPTLYAEETVEFDVDASHPNYEAIMYLMDKGVVDGYKDGTIKPDQPINRAELLKILVESRIGVPETFEYNRCFVDIEIIDWYIRYVCYAKSEGWVEGYEDGSFKPANTIDNVEALAMLFRTQGFYPPSYWEINEDPFADVSLNDWYGPYVWYAKENGIIDSDSVNYNPGTLVTRGEAFEMLYRTLVYKEELLKPVTYSDENVSFVHSGFYIQEVNEGDTTGLGDFFDMITVFTNENDDGIAFIAEATIDMLEEELEMTFEEILKEADDMEGVHADDLKVKDGRIVDLHEYNEFFDTYYDEFSKEGVFLFKVEPKFGSGDGVYIIAHYTDAEARVEVVEMISTIIVK
jgi:S-layer homology domain